MKITNYQISDKIGLIILQTLMFVAPIFECSPLSYVDEKTIFDIMPDFSVWGIGSIMFIVLASFIVSHRFVWLISFFVVAIIQCLSVIGDIKKVKGLQLVGLLYYTIELVFIIAMTVVTLNCAPIVLALSIIFYLLVIVLKVRELKKLNKIIEKFSLNNK